MGAGPNDVIIIVADEESKCKRALQAVVDRAKYALIGVPEETRSANPDGTTHFTRPRPGAARMYPETDVPMIGVTTHHLDRLRQILPEMREEKLVRIMKDYGLKDKLANQIINSEYLELFETMVRDDSIDSTMLAVTLTEDFKSLKRDGVKVETIGDEAIRAAFKLVRDGQTAKESLLNIFAWLAENPDQSPVDVLGALGLDMLSDNELMSRIEDTVNEKSEMITSMGARAFGPLMGLVMKEVRGKAEARKVQAFLRKAIDKHTKVL